jgi:beta-lactamase superfamily II metal-dependent hydrolase
MAKATKEPKPIEPGDLVVHFLNVGFGDNIVVQLPAGVDGKRSYGLVDCRNGKKTLDYLGKLMPGASGDEARLAFVCATHPHNDHISGIPAVINSRQYYPREFWDSGFRHNSQTYIRILESVRDKGIRMVRVSSGMEWYFHQIRITALSPSVALRNRFATYGVDMNNASIVLRIENNEENVITMQSKEYKGNKSSEAEREAGRAVVILTGDAEFDSWSHVCQEFPKVERSSSHQPLVTKMVNYLSGAVVKVAHHGSMHSTPLDVYEKIGPRLAVISTKQEESSKTLKNSPLAEIKRELFPHQSAAMSLEECDAEVMTTDGSYEGQTRADGTKKNDKNAHEGTIVVVIPPGGGIWYMKMNDSADAMATPPTEV